jgi:thiosulfate/3-mercaptopyruvate sulfurtransferase
MKAPALIIEPEELETLLGNPAVVIVDLCKPKQYAAAHIPGAHFVNYPEIVHIEKPVMGLLPSAEQFSKLVSSLGITADTHVVVYDDEGGGCASRFIWTLHVFGHTRTSLLNGGLYSWANEGHPLTQEVPEKKASDYQLTNTGQFTVDSDYIMQHLDDEHTALLDARSLPEYNGSKVFASKGGHIPGAKHYEWTDAMDRAHNLRLLPHNEIQQKLDQLGLTKDREIIAYCQSHHRSAFSYVMLRALGYDDVKGYPGSWSDWGNRLDTPVEQ